MEDPSQCFWVLSLSATIISSTHSQHLPISHSAFLPSQYGPRATDSGLQFENNCKIGVFSKLTNADCLVAIGGYENFYRSVFAKAT
ncbi:hypothetical protein Ahy_B10g102131 [Arachis hypogaea]|uniref:Uncharacterized protein n=1 Tax=Arachis hypogaea TaxID=3818 RepID=A0A444X180_ARAHY|nr:hypothetical protein Ahy_B10g102131 [Arachis hypogaea]